MRLDGSGSTVAAPDTAIGPPFFECVGLPDASSTRSLLEGSTIVCPASHTARAAYTYEAPAAVAAGLEVPRDPNAPGVRPFAIVLEDGTACMRGLTYQQGELGWAETGYTYTLHRDLHSFPTRRSSDLHRGARPVHAERHRDLHGLMA